MIDLLTTAKGTTVILDADQVDAEEVLEIAARLFEVFGLHGERVSRHLMYEALPLGFSECPHFTVGEENLVADFIQRGT